MVMTKMLVDVWTVKAILMTSHKVTRDSVKNGSKHILLQFDKELSQIVSMSKDFMEGRKILN